MSFLFVLELSFFATPKIYWIIKIIGNITDNIFIINAEGYNTLPYDSLKFLISNVPQYLKREIGRIGFQTVLKEVKQNRTHAFYHDRSTDPDIVKLKTILAELKEKQPDEAKLDDNPHKR